MHKAILIAASPNSESDDLAISIKKLLSPWSLYNKDSIDALEQRLGQDLKGYAITFDSARSAFYIYLLFLGGSGEVILPAFSCMVIANAVIWAGFKPVFVDCDPKDFNYDLDDLSKKITPRTKVILIQHSFGFPEGIAKIRSIVGADVKIVEDMAHSLGGSSSEGKLGTLADASILTFGIEKVISGVRGGMLIVRDHLIGEEIDMKRDTLPDFPFIKTIISLWNPILWAMITPVYYLGIGKLTLGRMFTYIGHKLGLFGNMIEDCEYEACRPSWLPSKMSPALSELALHQYLKLDRLNRHRVRIASIYIKELGKDHSADNNVYLRFPLRVRDRQELLKKAKDNGIVLGDWYKSILYAPTSSLKGLMYERGSCPNAEMLEGEIINLPTHIKVNEDDALRISKLVKPYLK